MAQIRLTNEWQALDSTTGTIQNVSAIAPIEVSESNVDNTGQVLFPGQAMSFSGVQLYARTTQANQEAEVRVSPFAEAGGGSGGGGGSSPGSTYILPTATATIKGGIKVGANLTIDAAGVLNATDTTYSQGTATQLGTTKLYTAKGVNADGAMTQKAVTDALAQKANTADLGTAAAKNTGTASGNVPVIGTDGKLDSSILPSVSLNDVYVVSSEAEMLALTCGVGDTAVRSDESKTYMLQKKPASVLANWVYLQSPTDAVQSVNGKTGVVTLETEKWKDVELSKSAVTVSTGYIPQMSAVSATTAALAKATTAAEASTVAVRDTDGTLKAATPDKATASDDTVITKKYFEDNGASYTLPIATADELGGIIVGDNLTIDPVTGKLSANAGGYTLPIAEAEKLGGVKVGERLTIDPDTGKLSANDQTAVLASVARTGKYSDLEGIPAEYTLPTASATIKGGVKVGGGLSMTGDTISVDTIPTGTATTAGLTKLYTTKGENTDGAMTQKAVKDNYLSLGGGAMTGAIEISGAGIKNTSTNYTRIQQGESVQNGAVLDFYGKDDTNGGRVVIACGTPDGTSYSSLVAAGNGGLTWGGKKVAIEGDYLPSTGGRISGGIYKTTSDEVLALSGSVDGGHGARLDLVSEGYTVQPDVQGAFGLHAIKNGSDHALIGFPDGRLTWDGNPIALGAIKRLTGSEINNYEESGSHNSNDLWVKAVFAAMPLNSTWIAYNSSGEEWSYIFSKGPTGNYGTILRCSHTGKMQVKGVATGGVLTKWRECNTTELAY